MSVSALMSVYNEENRLEATLKTLQWCDEIIILDKNSTDNTREIAKKYGAKIYLWNETGGYNSDEIGFLIEKSSYDWILSFTASDIIHPKLADEIRKLTFREFDYDAITVPYFTYIMGIDSKRSPWHTEYKTCIFRKSSIAVNNGGVHDAINLSLLKQYRLKIENEYCVYHLTHSSADIMMERHIRYWRGEAESFKNSKLKSAFMKVVKVIYSLLFRKKTYLLGWDGIMLMFAFLSYYMMSFVYKWEKKRGKAPEVYNKIRKDILSEWESLEK
jgi:glycosyltransferase involved in cell wall biosynthesis